MDPAQALAELKQISAQVQEAVLFDEAGGVLASTLEEPRSAAMADAAKRLLESAAGSVEGDGELVQIEAALPEGSVVAAREGGRAVAVTTVPDPTVGLIFYDLRTALRSLAETDEKPKPKPRRRAPARKKKEEESGAA